MRIYALVLFVFFTSVLAAQETKTVVGKWKVVAMAGQELFMDFKMDTAASLVPVAHQDTAMLRELLAITVASYAETIFIFGSNGELEEWYAGKLDAKGSYTIDQNSYTITRKVKRNGKNVQDQMRYAFSARQLQLVYLKNKEKVTLTLERTE